MTTEGYLLAISACLPLIIFVVWAFATRQPRYNAEKLLFFRNQIVAMTVGIIIAEAILIFIAWLIYNAGGCDGGFLSHARCTGLSDDIGSIMHGIWFLGAIYLVAACLPALILLGIIEFITRRKFRNSIAKGAAG